MSVVRRRRLQTAFVPRLPPEGRVMVFGYVEQVKKKPRCPAEVLKVFSEESVFALLCWAEAQGIPPSWLHRDHFDLWASKRETHRGHYTLLPTAEGRRRHAAFRRKQRALIAAEPCRQKELS